MKKIIFAIAVLLASLNAVGSPVKESPVVVLNTTHDIFYFKICKTMIGGSAKVFNAAGNVVITQVLDNRKLIIDFIDMKPGEYKIVVTKGDTEETFSYLREGYDNTVAVTDASISTVTPGK